MAAFPTLTAGPDSSKFTQSRVDNSMRKELEGGYVATRPRNTRAPLSKWKVTYTNISNADKALLDAHWDTQKGGSLIFAWTNPQSGTVYQVRYTQPLDWSYQGMGATQRWDCSFELEQA